MTKLSSMVSLLYVKDTEPDISSEIGNALYEAREAVTKYLMGKVDHVQNTRRLTIDLTKILFELEAGDRLPEKALRELEKHDKKVKELREIEKLVRYEINNLIKRIPELIEAYQNV